MRMKFGRRKFCSGETTPSRTLHRAVTFLMILIVLALTACSVVHAPSQNVLLVSHSGKSLHTEGPCAQKPEDDKDFAKHLSAITNAIATSTNGLTPDGTKRILIFVHGGLNTFNQSLSRANDIIPDISTNYYPFFINWDSGMKSSYLEHLFLVRQGEVQRVWGPVTFPFYLAADLGRAVTRAPVVWYYQLTSDLTTVADHESPNLSNRAKTNAMGRSSTNVHGLRISIGSDLRTGPGKLGYGITYVLTLPFKLATAPIIDAFGKSAWDNMSRRTQIMFHDAGEFSRPDSTNEIQSARDRVGKPPRGAVDQLMQSLDALTKTGPPNHYAITLIGHSMGAIVANEMVRSHPGLPYTNIVYMGAACSVSDFEKSVIPYLAQATNAHFYNLTLHPVAEAREAQWTFLDLVPRGSLLEWIDNFLATPRTIPERTLGKWDNSIRTTALIPEEVAGRVRIKAFAVGPREKASAANPLLHSDVSKDKVAADNPLVHSDFSEEPFWLRRFWTRPVP